MISDFKILTVDSLPELEAAVKLAISEGWQPMGSILATQAHTTTPNTKGQYIRQLFSLPITREAASPAAELAPMSLPMAGAVIEEKKKKTTKKAAKRNSSH